MSEIWKDVPGYEGLYQASNKGRVRSLVGWNGKEYIKRIKILTPTVQAAKGNYKRYVVRLTKNKVSKNVKLHRIIAATFIPNPNNFATVNHIDANTFNNCVENLEWLSSGDNVRHATKLNLRNFYRPSKEELLELYVNQSKTLSEISKEKNINVLTLERELRKYGIRIRTLSEQKDKYKITKDFLSENLKIKSQIELSKELGCDPSLISKYKKKFNL